MMQRLAQQLKGLLRALQLLLHGASQLAMRLVHGTGQGLPWVPVAARIQRLGLQA